MLVKIFIGLFFDFLQKKIIQFVRFSRLLETYPDLLSDILADTNEEQRRELTRMLSSQATTQ